MKSFSTDNFTFVDYTEMNDMLVKEVWETRNHPEVRKYMNDTEHIPFSDHINFINKLRCRRNVQYFSVLQVGGGT